MIANPTKSGLNVGQELQHGSSVFPGGVFPTQHWKNDMREWKRVGYQNLRQGGNNSNFQDAVNLQHQAVLLELAQGFNVLYVCQLPFSSHPYDYTNYYANYLLPDALWAQNAGVQRIEIGNENENGTTNGTSGRDPITSMTRVSNVVTVVSPTAHNKVTGDSIIYYNAASGLGSGSTIGVNTNGFFTITVIDAFTFTFASVGSNATTTIGWIQDTNTAVFSRIKRYATQLIADGITIPMEYSCLQGLDSAQHNHFNVTTFANMGRGNLAKINVNSYGAGNFPQIQGLQGVYQSFVDECTAAINILGASHFGVTEWNLGASNTTNFSTDRNINREYMRKRLDFLNQLGVNHYHFCWRFPDSRLQLKNDKWYDFSKTPVYNESEIQDPTFNDWWWDITRQRAPTITVGAPFVAANIQRMFNNRTVISIPRWSGLAMCYGQDEQSGTFNSGKANARFTELKGLGIKKLRIGFGDILNYAPGVVAVKQAALLAKLYGFYVVVVCAASPLSDANWSTYTTAVNTLADWALANNINEFQIGNEIEYFETTSGTLSNSVSKIKAMAVDVQNNHFTTGVVSYAMAQSAMEYVGAPNGWIQQGRGVLILGYNGYGDNGDFNQFKQRVNDLFTAFGTAVYLSEWNLNNNYANFPVGQTLQGQLILQRLQFIMTCGITDAYFFTYSWELQGDQFALHNANGTFKQPWLNALFVPKPRTITTGRTKTTGRTLG